MSLINDAARILRVGDEYSETNQKLIKAVDEFVDWLYEKLGGVNPPFLGYGLRLMRMNNSQIKVEFYVGPDNPVTNEVTFTTRSETPELVKVVKFCEYLNSNWGKNLFKWLEEKTVTRNGYVDFLEQAKQ